MKPPRKTKGGRNRYYVAFRLGGQGWPEMHGGSFSSRKDADARRDRINEIIAASTDPAEVLRRVARLLDRRPPERAAVRTVADNLDAMLAASVHLADSTRTVRHWWNQALTSTSIARRDIRAVEPRDVQQLVTELSARYAPATLRQMVSWLALAWDFAEVEPNPVRHRNVKLPKLERKEHAVATWAEVDAILEHIAPRFKGKQGVYRLIVRLLEATGLRVGELVGLTWGDVDWRHGRLRVSIARTKTAGGQRFISVPDELLAQLADLTPPDDRDPAARIFPEGITTATVNNAMSKACQRAGIVSYSPHDLRHRRISLWSAQGTPPALLSRRAGHSDVTVTQDVYSHVVAPDDDAWADFWRTTLARGE